MSSRSSNHGEKPASRKRRAPMAKLGIRIMSDQIHVTIPSTGTTAVITPITMVSKNKSNHVSQKSLRDVRPEKSKYFEKNVLIKLTITLSF